MNTEYDKTPSFFNDEETFIKYLGQTSYYIGLQESMKKLIEIAKPNSVLELGSATGATTLMLADNFKDINFVGVDMRQDVVNIANNLAKKQNATNVRFETKDMVEIAKNKVDDDFIFMLYSFHHIVDPLQNKIDFLNNIYKNMKKGAYLCISETFIPDKANSIDDSKTILDTWFIRKDEGYASTFWKSLSGLSSDEIQKAESIAKYCSDNEYLAGELVAKRDEEYLIQPKWLLEKASNAGFEIVINKPINIIEDRVILLRKN